jgi:DHA1 family bicyclomycin/chloramphenicol resistance-like MFS transporter
MALFIAGNMLCSVAPTFGLLLAGRLLSGFGAAAPRIVAVAVVRDAYGGRSMARVMSFVSSVFILVPVLAPSLGQAVLAIGTWRHIFAALVVIACANMLWFWLRQPETLPPARRARFSLGRATSDAFECFRHPLTLGYMVGSGVIFGALINYLSTAQQIFQEQYGAGKLFPIYFGLLASAAGVASFVNGRLVMRFGMHRLSRAALVGSSSLSLVAMLAAVALRGHPPLWALLTYLFPCFFCNGILFGNFSARAMEPMGHIAGVAAAVTSAVSLLVALAIGTPFGRAYDGTVRPLVAGYLTCGVLALLLTTWGERKAAAH